MIEIFQAVTDSDIIATRQLFREYETSLGLDLCFQGFEDELKALPGKYAPTEGRLFLALDEEQIAACIALRKLDTGICEMKRLFVREAFRSTGLGRMLIEKLLIEGRSAGYQKMRLDTYPQKMAKAVKLYQSYGFREIPPYYDNPYDGVVFMELDL